jgi:cob(I)alamin adenosyltransferase
MSFYTRKGDDGKAVLLSGGRLRKTDRIFRAMGSVDELNSAIGLARYYVHDDMIRGELREIRNDLFILGANLALAKGAGPKTGKVKGAGPGLEKAVEMKKAKRSGDAAGRLEGAIADIERRVKAPKEFVIFEGEGALWLDLARTAARDAERSVLKASEKYKIDPGVERYLNRLSSYLYAAALYVDRIEEIDDAHPTY